MYIYIFDVIKAFSLYEARINVNCILIDSIILYLLYRKGFC